MDSLFGNATTLLTFLLPGFLSAWVFYGLTSHPKPPQFERTVEALVFTFVVQALVTFTEVVLLLAGRCVVLGTWTESSSLLWGFSPRSTVGSGTGPRCEQGFPPQGSPPCRLHNEDIPPERVVLRAGYASCVRGAAVERWPPVDGIPQGMAGQSGGRAVLHADAGLDRGQGFVRCRR